MGGEGCHFMQGRGGRGCGEAGVLLAVGGEVEGDGCLLT